MASRSAATPSSTPSEGKCNAPKYRNDVLNPDLEPHDLLHSQHTYTMLSVNPVLLFHNASQAIISSTMYSTPAPMVTVVQALGMLLCDSRQFLGIATGSTALTPAAEALLGALVHLGCSGGAWMTSHLCEDRGTGTSTDTDTDTDTDIDDVVGSAVSREYVSLVDTVERESARGAGVLHEWLARTCAQSLKATVRATHGARGNVVNSVRLALGASQLLLTVPVGMAALGRSRLEECRSALCTLFRPLSSSPTLRTSHRCFNNALTLPVTEWGILVDGSCDVGRQTEIRASLMRMCNTLGRSCFSGTVHAVEEAMATVQRRRDELLHARALRRQGALGEGNPNPNPYPYPNPNPNPNSNPNPNPSGRERVDESAGRSNRVLVSPLCDARGHCTRHKWEWERY